MMRSKNRNIRRAMTLTEVLVTLGVLVILGAIVIPAFGLARIGKDDTPHMSNLRQLGVAMQVYAIDANGGLPPAIDPAHPKEVCADGSTWKHHLLPYLTKKTLFASGGQDGDFGKACPIGSSLRLLGHYGASVFWATSGVPGGSPMLKMSSFQIPSETFLIGINQDSSALVAPNPGPCPSGNGFASGWVTPVSKTTWLLADGHVDTFQTPELYDRECWRWRLTKPLEFFH